MKQKTLGIMVLMFFFFGCQTHKQTVEEYVQQASNKHNAGDHTGSISLLSKAIELNPKEAVLYDLRASEKVLLKDYTGAIQDLDKAIELDPKYTEAYFFRGATKSYIKDGTGALIDLKKASELGSTQADDFIKKYFSFPTENRKNIDLKQKVITNKLEEKAYVNSKYGFKINTPKGWLVNEPGAMGTVVSFFNTQIDTEGSNTFSTNINVVLDSSRGFKLNDYINDSKAKLASLFQGYKSVENKPLIVNGMPAVMIGTTVIQGKYHLHFLQLITIKGDKAYVVTGTTLESTWKRYHQLIESSLTTFNLN